VTGEPRRQKASSRFALLDVDQKLFPRIRGGIGKEGHRRLWTEGALCEWENTNTPTTDSKTLVRNGQSARLWWVSYWGILIVRNLQRQCSSR